MKSTETKDASSTVIFASSLTSYLYTSKYLHWTSLSSVKCSFLAITTSVLLSLIYLWLSTTSSAFLKESMIMLSVVIPTFNESKNIRNLVAQIDVALKGVDYEIVFVDDSKDNTPDVIMEVAKEYPQVRMEHRKNGTGLATAVLDGFKLAKGEYMACMDADLQHPPIVLKYMYRAMESGADFCIPSRLIPGGDDGGLNWYRKFVSGTARKIGQVMLPCLNYY